MEHAQHNGTIAKEDPEQRRTINTVAKPNHTTHVMDPKFIENENVFFLSCRPELH